MSNQEVQGALLSEICMTLRSAAREQRQGRSMRFDEICATAAVKPCIPFPQARTEHSATYASSSSLCTENPLNASIAAHAYTPDVRCHIQILRSVTYCSFVTPGRGQQLGSMRSRPDFTSRGPLDGGQETCRGRVPRRVPLLLPPAATRRPAHPKSASAMARSTQHPAYPLSRV